MKKIYTLLLLLSISSTCLFAQVEGTWRVASELQSLGVGPTQGDFTWWSVDQAVLDARPCFFDDQYIFNADGTFQNVLGDETWLEPWQGMDPEGCGAPIAPHDGSAAATWSDDGSSITITGTGAYLGLPKVHNNGELSNPSEAVASITYPYTIDGDKMTIDIDFGGGFWHFVLQKEGGTTGDTQVLPLTFEDASTDYQIFGFGSAAAEFITNPDATGENTSGNVAHINKEEGAEVWAGASLPLGEVIDLSAGGMFELKVWSPRAGVPIQLKFEDTTSPPDGNGNPSIIAELAVNTTTMNAWEVITFDMTMATGYDAANMYNQVVLFPDFGTAGQTGGESYYFDDIAVAGTLAIGETELAKVQLNAFPNPVDEVLNVSFDIPVAGNATLTLVDILGRTAKQIEMDYVGQGVTNQEITVNTLSAGTYVLLLRLDNQLIKTKNIVIK